MCAKTAVAPLERMKILLQAQSKHYSHLGVFSGLRNIVVNEGFKALYKGITNLLFNNYTSRLTPYSHRCKLKGNGAHMIRVFPYAATKFASYEMFKSFLGESHISRFVSGSFAGVTAASLTYPLDTIRARLSFQVLGDHKYVGIMDCATFMFKKEGAYIKAWLQP